MEKVIYGALLMLAYTIGDGGGGEMGKRNYCWKAIFFLRLLHEYANWAIAYSRPDGEVINWSLGKSTRRYNLIL